MTKQEEMGGTGRLLLRMSPPTATRGKRRPPSAKRFFTLVVLRDQKIILPKPFEKNRDKPHRRTTPTVFSKLSEHKFQLQDARFLQSVNILFKETLFESKFVKIGTKNIVSRRKINKD